MEKAMHISLTPMLDKLIKEKVASGLYNNASEVVREALVDQLKLNSLKVGCRNTGFFVKFSFLGFGFVKTV